MSVALICVTGNTGNGYVFSHVQKGSHDFPRNVKLATNWGNGASNCYSVDGSCGDTAGSYAGNSNIESSIIIGAGHKYLE